MVTLAEKYKDIPDCGAGPRFAYSTWPSASRNEQRSSTNDQHEGRIVDAVVSLCRGGENIYSIPVVQSSESAYTFVSSCLRGENQFYTPGSQLPSPVTACSYDARGYAISVTYPQGANGLPAGTTNYIYYDSQWQVLEVRTGGTAASNVTEQMVWSAAYINAAVLQDSYYNGVPQANQRLYFLQDANWNTTSVVGYDSTTGTWNVVQRYVYSPYGNITVLNADWSTPPAGTSPIVNNLYQGMSLDPVTGLYNERARWYSPSLGTWISQDPLQYINGANTYQFVMGNPVASVDPTGKFCWACFWAGVDFTEEGLDMGIFIGSSVVAMDLATAAETRPETDPEAAVGAEGSLLSALTFANAEYHDITNFLHNAHACENGCPCQKKNMQNEISKSVDRLNQVDEFVKKIQEAIKVMEELIGKV